MVSVVNNKKHRMNIKILIRVCKYLQLCIGAGWEGLQISTTKIKNADKPRLHLQVCIGAAWET